MKKLIAAFFAILLTVLCVLPSLAADNGVAIENYPTTEYTTASAKIATMELMYSSDEYGYDLYFDTKSAEFALYNKKTSEYFFSSFLQFARVKRQESKTGIVKALLILCSLFSKRRQTVSAR